MFGVVLTQVSEVPAQSVSNYNGSLDISQYHAPPSFSHTHAPPSKKKEKHEPFLFSVFALLPLQVFCIKQ